MAKKHIVILHSNDMHGDFQPQDVDGKETGGLARLSGYAKKVRSCEDNVIYTIAGDMFRGSIIDSEYLGLSTIDLVNLLEPDVACIGNHEVDYGLGHLLFLEKCATFPIINANMFITMNNTRLFTPYLNVEVGGLRILFIGILTEEVLASTKGEKVVGTFVDVEEAAREVGIICDNYRTKATDITILLTHIGIDLAARLDPHWGVDLIIGGHSHTFMDEMEVVNGVPIVQAGTGTDIIGRLDLTYNTWNDKLTEVKWQCVPINDETAPTDEVMQQMLDRYQNETDVKYRRVVGRLARKLTHPSRIEETELGNLYADMLQDESSFDLMLMGTGSIRKQELGPLIEYQDLIENTPFDDTLWMLKVTGAQLRRMVCHIMRDEAWEGHTEFYAFSRGFHCRWHKTTHSLEELTFHGKDVVDDQEILIALQNYHFTNFDEFLGVPLKEVSKNMRPRAVASAVNNIFEEYFATHPGLDARVEGRIVIEE